MARAITLKEHADIRHELMLKNLRTPIIYDPTPSDAPKWRGEAAMYFKTTTPALGFGIPQRAKNIAHGFIIPKRDEYSPEYIPDEDEDDVAVQWFCDSLNELQEYDVESIDVASLLHSHGYLSAFLSGVLSNKHACIRAKAAELITSMVLNHPKSKQLVIEGNGLQLLLHNFTTDPDTTSMTKTLGAISSLIMYNKYGINVFLRENCYEALMNALESRTVVPGSSTHTKVLNLIGYLRCDLKFGDLKFGDDSEVQEARQFKEKEESSTQSNLGLGPASPQFAKILFQ